MLLSRPGQGAVPTLQYTTHPSVRTIERAALGVLPARQRVVRHLPRLPKPEREGPVRVLRRRRRRAPFPLPAAPGAAAPVELGMRHADSRGHAATPVLLPSSMPACRRRWWWWWWRACGCAQERRRRRAVRQGTANTRRPSRWRRLVGLERACWLIRDTYLAGVAIPIARRWPAWTRLGFRARASPACEWGVCGCVDSDRCRLSGCGCDANRHWADRLSRAGASISIRPRLA